MVLYGWFMVTYGWFMDDLWCFMDDLWVIYGWFMVFYGWFMDVLWMIYGWFIDDLWVFDGGFKGDFYIVAKQWHLFLAIGFRPSLRPTDILTTRYLMIIPYAPYTYKTGWFLSGKCWDSYSSTMDHMGIMTYWCLFFHIFFRMWDSDEQLEVLWTLGMNDECWWLEKITAPWAIVIHNNSGYDFFSAIHLLLGCYNYYN